MKNNPCPRIARSHAELIREIEELEAQNKLMREALEWYSHGPNFDDESDYELCNSEEPGVAYEWFGKRARAVLAEIKGDD